MSKGSVRSGRKKGLRAPGQSREKNSPAAWPYESLVALFPEERRVAELWWGSHNHYGAPAGSLPALGARILENQEMPFLVALVVVLVAIAASAYLLEFPKALNRIPRDHGISIQVRRC
jgi:hypothetical protein